MNWFGIISIGEAILLLGVVWKAASLFQDVVASVRTLSAEVLILNETRDKHIELFARVVQWMDNMDKRQDRFDRRLEGLSRGQS